MSKRASEFQKLRPEGDMRVCRRCRQCGSPFGRIGVTCGMSQCQEAEYFANAERAMISKRRGRR